MRYRKPLGSMLLALVAVVALSGCGSAAALVRDVIEGYFEELTHTREMLDSRYNDMKSGNVQYSRGCAPRARTVVRSLNEGV